ncbi:MAG: hypothetical protein MRY64_02415 [Hyphomonadaceae bacterium]|nr:hypothetical protein [Hyphomonadaceae bacterium]
MDDAPVPDLAVPEAGRAATLSLACSGCHGPAGGAIAGLENYSAEQLQSEMMRYKTEPEGNSVMHRMMRGYSHEDIEAIAAYLGAEQAE